MAATTWIPAPRALATPARATPALATPGAPDGADRPVLHRVATRPRRRPVVLLAAVAVAIAVVGGGVVRAGTADAAPAAAGHVVLAPGETLWDLAVRSAAPGVDPRAQLRDLILLNDLDPAMAPAAWTVILLPAR